MLLFLENYQSHAFILENYQSHAFIYFFYQSHAFILENYQSHAFIFKNYQSHAFIFRKLSIIKEHQSNSTFKRPLVNIFIMLKEEKTSNHIPLTLVEAVLVVAGVLL